MKVHTSVGSGPGNSKSAATDHAFGWYIVSGPENELTSVRKRGGSHSEFSTAPTPWNARPPKPCAPTRQRKAFVTLYLEGVLSLPSPRCQSTADWASTLWHGRWSRLLNTTTSGTTLRSEVRLTHQCTVSFSTMFFCISRSARSRTSCCVLTTATTQGTGGLLSPIYQAGSGNDSSKWTRCSAATTKCGLSITGTSRYTRSLLKSCIGDGGLITCGNGGTGSAVSISSTTASVIVPKCVSSIPSISPLSLTNHRKVFTVDLIDQKVDCPKLD
jgi:hypothetical protein